MRQLLMTVHVGEHPGKWYWSVALQLVEFVPKGRRNTEFDIPLSIRNNYERKALAVACIAARGD